MYIIRVVPSMRSTFAEELTYFSKQPFEPGSLITVSLRNKEIHALVIESSELSENKAEVRQADFTLRRLEPQPFVPSLSPAFIKTIKYAANYYVTTPGRILYDTLPQAVRSMEKLPETKEHVQTVSKSSLPTLLQARWHTRKEEYISAIRHAFSRQGSVILLAPSIQDAETLYNSLGKGIREFSYLFHSGISKGRLQDRWNNALGSRHAIVAVMTPGFLALPRHDIHTMIIDQEASHSYKQHIRPFVDYRNVALWYAKELGVVTLLADEPLRVESMHSYQSGYFDAHRDIPTMLTSLPPTHVIDMRREDSDPNNQPQQRKFRLLSDSALEEIDRVIEKEGNVFFFTARRGLSPTTLCQDCGSRVSCNTCGASVVLHRGVPEHLFICHACGTIRSAHERCTSCNSWRLISLGIGTQLIERELSQRYPDIPRFILDRDTASTSKQARDIATAFSETNPGFLLGTEMALAYIKKEVDFSLIVSLDSLFAMPEWNIYERVYSIITRVQESTRGRTIIQTRKPDEDILHIITKGRVGTFYQQELEDRRQFGYPPFSTIIKLECKGREREIAAVAEEVEEKLAPYGFVLLPKTFELHDGTYVRHGFIRLKHQSTQAAQRRRRGEKRPVVLPPWPNKELNQVLRELPEQVTVEVDPYTIL